MVSVVEMLMELRPELASLPLAREGGRTAFQLAAWLGPQGAPGRLDPLFLYVRAHSLHSVLTTQDMSSIGDLLPVVGLGGGGTRYIRFVW